MAKVKTDEDREQRILMEAVVDAYGEMERAMGWYYYLDDRLCCPFSARCTSSRAVSPLKTGQAVRVTGMAPEEECEAEMFVMIKHGGRKLAVPLAQLEIADAEDETRQAVEDWHYWVAQGYRF